MKYYQRLKCVKYFVIFLILVISLGYITPQALAIGPPPPERVPVSILRVIDIHGNSIDLVNNEEQIQIQADLANAQDTAQSLAYIVEVYDKDNNQVFRGWIEATLEPKESFSPAVSWIPEKPGYYLAKMMVWEALDNPSSLSPPLEAEFYVVDNMNALNENRRCSDGKELVFKINYKKVACVFSETLVKLVGRGWANWHNWYSPLFIKNLREVPQDVDEVHAEFVKREVMKNSQVAKHFLSQSKINYDCCTYQLAQDYPDHYQLVINFRGLPNDKQLVAVYDLRQLKVVESELTDMIQFGGSPITEQKHQEKSIQEHYEIEIIGLKDEYRVGEPYSFYFVISGYGYACASYEATYPDENGNIMKTAVDVLCAAEQPMMDEFEINFFEQKGTLGNVGIKNPGTYTVTVTFEKPNKFFPTTASKDFRVVEN